MYICGRWKVLEEILFVKHSEKVWKQVYICRKPRNYKKRRSKFLTIVSSSVNPKYTCRADKVAYIDRFDSAFSVQDFNLISRSSVLLKDLDMFSSMEEREDWTELSSLDWVSTFSKTSFSLVSARADRS